MPIYEYTCTKCGHEFEVMQKFSDKPIRKCEKCGGKVKKQISSTAFVLKGTGWYVTDYARKDKGENKNSTEKKEPKTEKKETKKEEKSGGAKPKS